MFKSVAKNYKLSELFDLVMYSVCLKSYLRDIFTAKIGRNISLQHIVTDKIYIPLFILLDLSHKYYIWNHSSMSNDCASKAKKNSAFDT